MDELEEIKKRIEKYLGDDYQKRHKIKKPYVNNTTVTLGIEDEFCRWAGIDEETPVVLMAEEGKHGRYLSLFVPNID